jgi:hypothetical protein
MKKLAVLGLLALATNSYAGLITRTYIYSDGNTISANENNTNENTLYNEINGNLDSNNLAANAVNSSEIAANAVTMGKLDSNLQGFFTYRRPNLVFVDTNTVDVEGNTGTANQTCVFFPDERRCVTETTSSTDQFRRLKMSATATLSGTWDSGLRSGLTLGTSSWWLIYAVKTTDNSSNFVLVVDSVTPTQGNYALLNSNFGSNSWVYLGAIRYGDNSNNPAGILSFTQSGGKTEFTNLKSASNPGIILNTQASGTNIDWEYNTGVSSVAVPSNFVFGIYTVTETGACTPWQIRSGDRNQNYFVMDTAGTVSDFTIEKTLNQGLNLQCSGSSPQTINLTGWTDNALYGGNPQL